MTERRGRRGAPMRSRQLLRIHAVPVMQPRRPSANGASDVRRDVGGVAIHTGNFNPLIVEALRCHGLQALEERYGAYLDEDVPCFLSDGRFGMLGSEKRNEVEFAHG